MNIDANNALQLNTANKISHEQQPVVAPQQDPVKKVVNKAETNQVSLSSRNLQNTYSGLSDTSDIDLEKVSLIQQALAEEQLALEDEKLVEAMMETHKHVLELLKR